MSSVTLASLFDGQTVSSRLVISALIVVGAIVVMVGMRFLVRWRIEDPAVRYHSRKIARYAIVILALIGLGFVWRPFAGQLGLVVGLLAAGMAFALQEVIGAVAGWANIVSGGMYRVGDRIEIAGVRGDVIDITLLRTKLMEIGSPIDSGTWVRGRQAEKIMLEEARAVSRSEGAQEAMELMLKRYPVPRVEMEPHVFVRATDNWMELAARFIVPVRTARSVKDGLSRRIKQRLDEAGIEIASETIDATVHGPRDGGGSRSTS